MGRESGPTDSMVGTSWRESLMAFLLGQGKPLGRREAWAGVQHVFEFLRPQVAVGVESITRKAASRCPGGYVAAERLGERGLAARVERTVIRPGTAVEGFRQTLHAFGDLAVPDARFAQNRIEVAEESLGE